MMDQFTHNEKELLNALGKYPTNSMKELLSHMSYKWTSTVVRKINYFKKQSIVYGPIYDVNYNKLCKNPLHKLFCVLEINQYYENILSYLTLIEPVAWIFPVLSPHRQFLLMGYYSSDDREIEALFQLLKEYGIITDYMVRCYSSKRMIENPNFFGSLLPSLDHLLDPCELPDISLKDHDTDWNKCDIAILPYLATGYKNAKMIEILKKEKEHQRTWKYSQICYSRGKMITNGLIEKKYLILPSCVNQCTYFFLFLKTEPKNLTHRALYNFVKGERVYKEYVTCREGGILFCVSHSSLITELMRNLDVMEEITEKELYLLRSTWGNTPVSEAPRLKSFDIETQTLKYPYHVYREQIMEKLEDEKSQLRIGKE